MKRMLTFTAVALLVCFVTVSPLNAFTLSLDEPVVFEWHSVMGPLTANPVIEFEGDLTKGETKRDRFSDTPKWIVPGAFGNDGKDDLVVLFDDGTLRYLSFSKNSIRTVSTSDGLSPDSPPVILNKESDRFGRGILCIDDRGDMVLITPENGRKRPIADGFSKLTYPTVADLDGDGEIEILVVDENGRFTVITNRNVTRTEKRTTLLPDARIVVGDLNGDKTNEAVALTRPTSEFEYTRLGDNIEAGGLAVFSWDGKSVNLEDEFKLTGDLVFEDHTPLLADISDEEGLEIIVPVTEDGNGTKLWSFYYISERIREIRRGPASKSTDWVQPLGVGVLGDSDRKSILYVTNPDSSGTLEVSRTDLANTRIKAENSISIQIPGTRTIETALIGDFDSDGGLELLAPSADRKSINLFSLEKNRFRTWEIYSGNRVLSTNIAPGDFNGDGKHDVVAGFDDGSVIIILGE